MASVGKQARRVWLIWAAAGAAAAFVSLTERYLRARYRERVTTTRPPPPDAIRIVALGDSIVAGIEAGPGPAWPQLLGTHLQSAYPETTWHICNGGVPGDTALLGLNRFDRDVAPVRPHVVLVAFGLNDCHLNRHALDHWFEEHLPRLTHHSYLWRSLRSRAQGLLHQTGLIPPPLPEVRPVRHPRTTLRGFDRALSELIHRARLIGARPVLVAMTPLANVMTEAVIGRLSTYSLYNSRIAEVAKRTDIPLVRPASASSGFWLDDGLHLSSNGQAWLAREVFLQLDQAGLWRELLPKVSHGW